MLEESMRWDWNIARVSSRILSGKHMKSVIGQQGGVATFYLLWYFPPPLCLTRFYFCLQITVIDKPRILSSGPQFPQMLFEGVGPDKFGSSVLELCCTLPELT